MSNIYTVYHPVDGSINHDCTPGLHTYQKVITVQANSLEDAFKLSQNDFNKSYARLGIRSTCVGDIIQSHTDWENKECHLVKNIGFQTVSNRWITFLNHATTI